MNILIKNGELLIDDNFKMNKPKHIIIEGDRINKITETLPFEAKFDQIIDAKDCMIIPGLINSHNHSYANLLKGTTENIPLEIWMMYAIAGGANRTPREIYICTLLGAIQMLKTGTTTVLDQLSLDEAGLRAVLQAYEDIGMRAAVAPMIANKRYYDTIPMGADIYPEELKQEMDANPLPSIHELISTCENLIHDFQGRGGRLNIIIGPSAPQRCSIKLLEEAIALAETKNVPLHTHLLESKAQAVIAYEKYGKSMTEFLDEVGFLQPRTSLAHSVWLTDGEIELVAQRGASVVHNPVSNLMLGSGVAPVLKYLDAGINVALGTDGANCGGSQNLFEAMSFAGTLHKIKDFDYTKWITAEDVYKMATSSGAKVFLQEDEIGSLKEGYKADLVILNKNTVSLSPMTSPKDLLVYSENGSSVRDVIISGQVIVERGSLKLIKEEDVIVEARELAEKIKAKTKDVFAFFKKQEPFVNHIYREAVKKDLGINRLFN